MPLHPNTAMKAFLGLLLPLFLVATAASAAKAEPIHVLVSVGEISPHPDLASWQKEACALIHQIGNQTITAGVQVSCRQDSIHVIDTYLQQLKADNSYHIRLLRGFKGSYRLTVSNWNRSLESDFGTLGWNIGQEPQGRALREEGLKAVLTNFFSYLEQEDSLKTQWLLVARSQSKTITYDFKQLHFKSRQGGRQLSLLMAARLFEKESVQNAEYLRSRQELALAFTTLGLSDLNILRSESSLRTLLEKAAREGQMAAILWRHVIKFDQRGASGLTLELIDQVAQESLAPRDFSLQIKKVLRQPKKASGPLIFLF